MSLLSGRNRADQTSSHHLFIRLTNIIMLEYVFFDPRSCDKFIAILKRHEISFQQSDDEEVLIIAIPEGLREDLIKQVENHYDDLMEYSSELMSNQTDDGQINAAGLTITLSGGRISYAVLPPSIINKVMSVLEYDELNTLINAITSAVEDPDDTPLCKRTYGD